MVDDRAPQRPQFDATELASVRPERVTLKMLLFLGICFMVLNSVITTVGVLLIRDTQTQSKPINENTNFLVRQFKDCLDPGGECFEASVEATARELGQVDHQNRQVSAATAACGARLASQIAEMTRHEAFLAIYACQQAELRDKR